MRMLCIVAALTAALISGGGGQEKSPTARTGSQVLKALRSAFRERNSTIGYVELLDVRPLYLEPLPSPPTPSRYLILARGIRPDLRFSGNFEQELFGLFLFDDSLTTITRTVAMIPTRRWADYAVKIVKVWKDSVAVHGEGMAYGDQQFDGRYSLLK